MLDVFKEKLVKASINYVNSGDRLRSDWPEGHDLDAFSWVALLLPGFFKTSSRGWMAMLRPEREAVHADRCGQAAHQGRNDARPPRAAAAMTAVFPAGQVTVPARRSMVNWSLENRPAALRPGGHFAVTVKPCPRVGPGGGVSVGRVADDLGLVPAGVPGEGDRGPLPGRGHAPRSRVTSSINSESGSTDRCALYRSNRPSVTCARTGPGCPQWRSPVGRGLAGYPEHPVAALPDVLPGDQRHHQRDPRPAGCRTDLHLHRARHRRRRSAPVSGLFDHRRPQPAADRRPAHQRINPRAGNTRPGLRAKFLPQRARQSPYLVRGLGTAPDRSDLADL